MQRKRSPFTTYKFLSSSLYPFHLSSHLSSLTPSSSLIILPFLHFFFSLTYTLYTQQLGFVVDTAMHRPDSLPSRLKHLFSQLLCSQVKKTGWTKVMPPSQGQRVSNNRSLVVSKDPFSLPLLGEQVFRDALQPLLWLCLSNLDYITLIQIYGLPWWLRW